MDSVFAQPTQPTTGHVVVEGVVEVVVKWTAVNTANTSTAARTMSAVAAKSFMSP